MHVWPGAAYPLGATYDIVWLHPDGRPMAEGDWTADGAKAIGMYLNGYGIAGADATGNPIVDDHFLLYFNAGAEDVLVVLPPKEYSSAWGVVIDTAAAQTDKEAHQAGAKLELPGRSLVVLREYAEPEDAPDLSVAASLVAMAAPGTSTRSRLALRACGLVLKRRCSQRDSSGCLRCRGKPPGAGAKPPGSPAGGQRQAPRDAEGHARSGSRLRHEVRHEPC